MLEKLKKLLEEGKITQEEFDEMAKDIPDNDPATDPAPETDPPAPAGGIDYDKIEKIVQSRVDKAMAEERKEKAELKKKYENLQKAKLTDEELKQAELDERAKDIADREKALKDKENRLFAVKAIKEAGLDDGSDTSLALVEFVIADEETEITEKVKAFKALFDKAVSAEVSKRFKDGGRNPAAGTHTNGGKNPYKKDQFNFTEQMRIESENPELAAKLRAEAGV